MRKACSIAWTCVCAAASLSWVSSNAMAQDDFKILKEWKGHQSGVQKATQLVVKDAKTWAELWDKVHASVSPKPELPQIDFDKHMVLAVFMGTRRTGGYAIQITDIHYDKQADKLVVRVKETSPPPGSIVIQVITHPFHIVVIPKSDKPVQFLTKGS